ncbi:hypothetical protein C8R46DRAFT_224367 [Mycena filopes]|nr:hypothetical protein C8R46DRAFT_224367 [Mycena filopes]
MLTAMNWPSRRLSVAVKHDPAVVQHGVDAFAFDDKSLPATPASGPLPPTPGLKPPPPSIAQLAMPSPDESSSSSSNASHEVVDLTKYDAPSPRRPNRLRKAPPSSYPFSFVPEDPPPVANFPYTFHRSTPNSPAQSFVGAPARAMSMHAPSPPRKLAKPRRRASGSTPPASAAADMSMARISEIPPVPPLPPKNSFNFSLRRKRTSRSEGHSPALPDLPPPSPLTLNIPTFLPFHARKRDSWHIQSASASPLSAPSRPTVARSPSDDVFSQAAWNGVVTPAGRAVNRSGWKSTWSLSMSAENITPPALRPAARSLRSKKSKSMLVPSPRSESPEPIAPARPPLLRRHAVSAQPKRRWTLAMALTDEGISDELLVEKLEALRSRSRATHHAPWDDDDADVEWDRVWAAYDDELDADWVLQPTPSVPPTPPPKDGFVVHAAQAASMPSLSAPLPLTPSTATWQTARRALLTCRELVRTERHYLASLHSLLTGETRAPPPPLMRAYAAALAKESANLLRRMEEDPSAWGVAAAFLGAEDALEAALVGWCGVVGGWFVDGAIPTPPRRLSKMRTGSVGCGEELGEGSEAVRPTAKRAASWRKRGSSFLSFPSSLSLSLSSAATSPDTPSATTTRARSKRERDARPAVRDLAIVPTQRVMRYVLLYRDLLEHTPVSSPSRALVARAVDTAVRIAQRCDRAQGNAAFLQRR